MKDSMLKFGCFLTGYNYTILRECSEASTKQLKKYMSAILIITILWGFIGFSFADRYLQTPNWASAIVAFVMVIIVIQIERQIILTTEINRWAFGFRVVIGIVMAVIGSVIIDQIIFKEDVEKVKITSVQEEVNKKLPEKTLQIDSEITELNSRILEKEAEHNAIIAELDRNPYITTYNSVTDTEPDSTGVDQIISKTMVRQQVPNPKTSQLSLVYGQIEEMRHQKSIKESLRMDFRNKLEEDLRSKTAFLDEITLFTSILLASPIGMTVWGLIFIFFLFLELFVIINKMGGGKDDYDSVILHQVAVRNEMIAELRKKNQSHKNN
jgi:hypothetical protein